MLRAWRVCTMKVGIHGVSVFHRTLLLRIARKVTIA